MGLPTGTLVGPRGTLSGNSHGAIWYTVQSRGLPVGFRGTGRNYPRYTAGHYGSS